MGENLLVSVTADVMLYEDQAKQWVRPGENGSYATITNCGTPDMQKLSNVQILQGTSRTTFRIVAVRIHDGQILIDQLIFQKLKYQAATKCFHQWRNERRQVFGLSFSTEQEAEKFLSVVQRIMECVSSNNDTHYSNGNGNNGNGFQEVNYQQLQQNHYKEPDQDSIGSGNGVHNNMVAPSYRKSSYSANAVYGVGAMSSSSNNSIHVQPPSQQYGHYPQQQTVANGIQRRASQGSNNSSSTNSSGVMNSNNNNGAGIYAQANTNTGRGPMLSSANIQLNQAHVDALNTVAPVPPAASSSIPPISSNAPPPPPPPPPSLNVAGSRPTLADQLKQAQLRKASSATSSSAASVGVNRTSSTGGETTGPNKTSTVSSSGHSDLLSELAATINKRKNNAESNSNGVGNNASSNHTTEVHEKRVNGGDPAPRPWQKPALNPTVTSATTSSDSPRVNRKVPSGSSLSSQEESGTTTNKEVNTNGVSGSNATATTITTADLDRFKNELMLEFQQEIIKMKQEIIGEIAQLLQKQ